MKAVVSSKIRSAIPGMLEEVILTGSLIYVGNPTV